MTNYGAPTLTAPGPTCTTLFMKAAALSVETAAGGIVCRV
jgi:hypothetical protein